MAEIICVECTSKVSDESGYCPECGYPFDNPLSDQKNIDGSEADSVQPNVVVTAPLDTIMRSLDSIKLEMKELQGKIDENGRVLNSHSMESDDSTRKMLTAISTRIDKIAFEQEAIKAAFQPDDHKRTKNSLLSAFYKTLNSPNSMFEYMFYICVVQVVFVIVNLFLATYIVTLVR